MTKHFAVLGSPISHSLSPIIHTAAFEYLGTDADYKAVDVSDLHSFLIENSDFYGLSLTMPLKDQAYAYADELSSGARMTEAVNTLISQDGKWYGHNTDIFGIQQAIKGVQASTAIVIGTGATARSAIVALQELGVEILVQGRNQTKLEQLQKKYGVELLGDPDEVQDWPLVISTLPSGVLDEFTNQSWNPTGVLLDVAYHPWPSTAARIWSGRGKAISGLEMLIWQAIAQQRLFHGNSLDQPLSDESELHLVITRALGMAK